MGGFEYRQAAEIRDCFTRHGVRYLFIGKSGAILLGFPDTTQDADLFVEKTPANGERLVAALLDLGFDITMASKRSRWHGSAASRWMDSRCATSTTSSPAPSVPMIGETPAFPLLQ